jgi:hypothetical protein
MLNQGKGRAWAKQLSEHRELFTQLWGNGNGSGSVGGHDNDVTYPAWLFQCAAATRTIPFPESAPIVNPIHVEPEKAGDEDDVDARIAFQNFCAALSVVRR